MTAPAAITGNYSNLVFVKTRSVAVIYIEIPIEASGAFVQMFGTPNPGAEVPVALARMDPEKAATPEPQKALVAPPTAPAGSHERRKWEELPLTQQAAIRCQEVSFRRFLAEVIDPCPDIAVYDGDMAADVVRTKCGVTSRKHIAESPKASAAWIELDTRYQLWMRGVEA